MVLLFLFAVPYGSHINLDMIYMDYNMLPACEIDYFHMLLFPIFQ